MHFNIKDVFGERGLNNTIYNGLISTIATRMDVTIVRDKVRKTYQKTFHSGEKFEITDKSELMSEEDFWVLLNLLLVEPEKGKTVYGFELDKKTMYGISFNYLDQIPWHTFIKFNKRAWVIYPMSEKMPDRALYDFTYLYVIRGEERIYLQD